jgi:hypothetical protein
MKALTITKYLFTILGLIGLIVAGIILTHTRTFLESAIKTQGTVVDLVIVKSDHQNFSGGVQIRSSTHPYAPVVEFITTDGRRYSFTSSIRTYPPAYDVGEKVSVLYDETNPNDASINSFFPLWASTIIFGSLGTLFSAIGITMFGIDLFRNRKNNHLIENGMKITTKLHSIEFVTGLVVNGRNPYRIRSLWKNPRTAETHIFSSDNIWFDPTGHVPEEITVYIEHENPKRYSMDLLFLPVAT